MGGVEPVQGRLDEDSLSKKNGLWESKAEVKKKLGVSLLRAGGRRRISGRNAIIRLLSLKEKTSKRKVSVGEQGATECDGTHEKNGQNQHKTKERTKDGGNAFH